MPRKTDKEIAQDAARKLQREMLTARPPGYNKRDRVKTGGLGLKFASESLGVNPNQIPEATKALRAAGVMADFDKEGRLLVSSAKQYRDAAKACGLWTGRDGYGGGQDQDGRRIGTGRETERRKQEFRDAVARGEYDV